MVVALTSKSGKTESLELSNYATRAVKDELSRITGVGDINVFGSIDYSMRVWLDPEKLRYRNLTTQDVLDAISEQNVQVAAGKIGEYPSPDTQSFEYSITALGRLRDEREFADIIVKTDPGTKDVRSAAARLTRIKDVARVELGGQVYTQWCDIGE